MSDTAATPEVEPEDMARAAFYGLIARLFYAPPDQQFLGQLLHMGAFDEVSGDAGLKSHAVFVLSQLPRREGVPALLDVARHNPDQRTRGRALFWLGQSGDPRALDLIESILRR